MSYNFLPTLSVISCILNESLCERKFRELIFIKLESSTWFRYMPSISIRHVFLTNKCTNLKPI